MKRFFTKLTFAMAFLLMGSSYALAETVAWTAVNGGSYSQGQELSSNTSVVSVKLGTGSDWSSYVNGKTFGGIYTNAIAELTDNIPTSGTYIVIKPVEDVTFSLSTYASTNHNLVVREAAAPTTDVLNYRQRYAITNDLGTLSAGKTYYIYSLNLATFGFVGFTANTLSKENYDYIVKDNFGNELAKGSAAMHETVNVYWHKYILHEGKWYVTNTVGTAITKDNANVEVKYTLSDINYFFEAESILSRSYGNLNGEYSGGVTAGVYTSANLTMSGVASGYYTITVNSSVRRPNDDMFTVQVSTDNTNWTDAGTLTLTSNVAGNFSIDNVMLPGEGYIRLVEAKTQNMCHYVDYVIMKKTGDAAVTVSGSTITPYVTFSSKYALDFTDVEGIKAYVATGYTDEYVTVEEVTGAVPANTGLLIKGAGSAEVPVAASATAPENNLLVAVAEETVVSKAEDGTNYVLAYNATADGYFGFYYINNTPATVGAGTAYLHTPTALGAKLRIFMNDDATAITNVKTSKSDNIVYNLAGQRVNAQAKGIVIINGKKVMVK